MGIKKTAQKAINKLTGKNIVAGRLYDYSEAESRKETVLYLYEYAKQNKVPYADKMIEMDNYYNNQHVTQLEIQKACEEKGLPFIPAIVPDPYIHVESQIIPNVPDFEFSGRDDDMDSIKAKQREYVVKYVVENNKLETMNTDNERRLNKLGDAFWKVSFDYSRKGPGYWGDIIIGNPSPANIFPDPAAIEIDDCEYIDYVYRLHKMKIARLFRKDLERIGKSVHDIGGEGNYSDTEIFSTKTHDSNDDTLQIVEHWFRQPVDGSETYEYTVGNEVVKRKVKWEAGDIACSIMIGNEEVRYIPKYWEKTGEQNKKYPFVKYCKIPVDGSFWDKSEIEPIKELVDAADREFALFILNDTFNGNDITVMEQDAFADEEPENIPGAFWKVKQGQVNNVKRLGGLSNLNGGLKDSITFIRNLIQETAGNFESSQGSEPVRVTTASGIAQLNERADARKNIKKADRLTGFELLFELIDWTALEFFDDDRLIFIGVKDEKVKQNFVPQEGYRNIDPNKGPIAFNFNSDKLRVLDAEKTDATMEASYYYPRIDAAVRAGDGIQKSKAFTLSAIQDLLKLNITPQNYKIVQSMINLMDIPERKEINEYLEKTFTQVAAPQAMPGTQQGQQMPGSQIPGQSDQLNPDDILAGLSEQEMTYLHQHPEILAEVLGGGQNEQVIQGG